MVQPLTRPPTRKWCPCLTENWKLGSPRRPGLRSLFQLLAFLLAREATPGLGSHREAKSISLWLRSPAQPSLLSEAIRRSSGSRARERCWQGTRPGRRPAHIPFSPSSSSSHCLWRNTWLPGRFRLDKKEGCYARSLGFPGRVTSNVTSSQITPSCPNVPTRLASHVESWPKQAAQDGDTSAPPCEQLPPAPYLLI